MSSASPATPDVFVPLRGPAAPVAAPFSALAVKVLPQGAAQPAFQPVPSRSAEPSQQSSAACGEPVVTLQRDGDIVARIRIQCGCGRVLDLDCSY